MSVMTVLSNYMDNDEDGLIGLANDVVDSWNTGGTVRIFTHMDDGDISDEDVEALRMMEHELFKSLTRQRGIVGILAEYMDSDLDELACEILESCRLELFSPLRVNLKDCIDEETYLSDTETWKKVEAEIQYYLDRTVFPRMLH